MILDKDGKPGLRIESAASVTLRDTIMSHFSIFGHVIKTDRAAGQSVVAAYIDGLAGATALVIAGGHASKEDAIYASVRAFKDALERDLASQRATRA